MAAFPLKDLSNLRVILDRMEEISPIAAKMLEFEARTGLRYVDLAKLTFDELMTPEGNIRDSITVVQSKTYNARITKGSAETQAKSKSKIVIDFNAELKSIIRSLYVINGQHDLVFQSNHHSAKKGAAISNQYINRTLKRAQEGLGLGYSLSTHSMRKTFANILRNKGADVEIIRQALGHSSILTTQAYLNTFENEKKEFTTGISF